MKLVRQVQRPEPVLLPQQQDGVKPQHRMSARPASLSRRIVGLVLVVVSLIVGITAVHSADERRYVVIAAREISPGVAITAQDLTVTLAHLGSSEGVYPSDPKEVVGQASPIAIAAGQLIPRLQEQIFLPVVSLPVRAHHLPMLQRGDRVDIWTTSENGPSTLVVASAAVAELGVNTGAMSSLSIAIAEGQVARVISAAASGVITVVRR